MPTYYLRTRTGLAFKKAGRRHAAYIAGKKQYCDKSEVKFVIDKNLPTWANDADEFFAAADENERANGRSYRSIVFAIPHEAPDKKQWSQQFVDQLLGDRHAYRLAIHIPDNGNNPHAHLMFSERGLKDLEVNKFFSRSNAKNPIYSGNKSKQWLESAKRHYLALIRVLCPTYTPPNRREQKVGPKLLNPSPVYEEQRQERERTVLELRRDIQEFQSVMEEIARLPKTPRYSVLEAIQAALEDEQRVSLDDAAKRFKPVSSASRKAMNQVMPTATQIQRPRLKFR